MEFPALKPILEAAIMAAEAPVPAQRLLGIFSLLDEQAPGLAEIEAALQELRADYAGRGVELVEVAGGYRFQTRALYAEWVNRLWEERKPRYSRALLETIAIIAYRQPITRSEIEDIRGVAVTTAIIRTLQERDWVKVVGHRDVPGKPALYATTRQFLEYFNLPGLGALPTLAELRDIEELSPDLFAVMQAEELPPGEADDRVAGSGADETPRQSGDPGGMGETTVTEPGKAATVVTRAAAEDGSLASPGANFAVATPAPGAGDDDETSTGR